jgi:hypothetical protein
VVTEAGCELLTAVPIDPMGTGGRANTGGGGGRSSAGE